jgi:hypothetical protein
METEQMREMLAEMRAAQEEMKAGYKKMTARLEAKIVANYTRTEVNHEEMMAKLYAHHEMMMACLGKTEATDLEENPEKIQSEAVHRE